MQDQPNRPRRMPEDRANPNPERRGALLLRITKKQADLLYRLIDSYVDAAGETQENRSDLAMAKRVRDRLLFLVAG